MQHDVDAPLVNVRRLLLVADVDALSLHHGEQTATFLFLSSFHSECRHVCLYGDRDWLSFRVTWQAGSCGRRVVNVVPETPLSRLHCPIRSSRLPVVTLV